MHLNYLRYYEKTQKTNNICIKFKLIKVPTMMNELTYAINKYNSLIY
jgi:hypothetical protein